MAAEHACNTHTPQRHGYRCQAIRHYRRTYGIRTSCRPSSICTRSDAGIGRHPKVKLDYQPRRTAASSSSDRAPGTCGCGHDAIVTGYPDGRLDSLRLPGYTNETTSRTIHPTRGTGTDTAATKESEDRYKFSHAPGVGKASLRTRTSNFAAARRSIQPGNTTGSRTAECASEGAARCESPGVHCESVDPETFEAAGYADDSTI